MLKNYFFFFFIMRKGRRPTFRARSLTKMHLLFHVGHLLVEKYPMRPRNRMMCNRLHPALQLSLSGLLDYVGFVSSTLTMKECVPLRHSCPRTVIIKPPIVLPYPILSHDPRSTSGRCSPSLS